MLPPSQKSDPPEYATEPKYSALFEMKLLCMTFPDLTAKAPPNKEAKLLVNSDDTIVLCFPFAMSAPPSFAEFPSNLPSITKLLMLSCAILIAAPPICCVLLLNQVVFYSVKN